MADHEKPSPPGASTSTTGELTTAQRLAAYWDELLAAGFGEDTVVDYVQLAAPSSLDGVVLKRDLGAATPQ